MFTPAQLLAMTDNELGTHASGGYGAKLRNEFYASLRAGLAKADAKTQILDKQRSYPVLASELVAEFGDRA